MSREPWFLNHGEPVSLDWKFCWARVMEQFAERPCIRLPHGVMTYSQLDGAASLLALACLELPDWRPGVRVLLPVTGPEFVERLTALWLAGGVAIPVFHSADRRASNTQSDFIAEFSWLADLPSRTSTRLHPIEGEERWQAVHFTSGSTGVPRAVVRGWRQALYEGGHYAAVLGLERGMECTTLIHPAFGAFTKHYLGCLLSGCLQTISSVNEVSPSGGDLLYATPSQVMTLSLRKGISTPYRAISLTGEAISQQAMESIRRVVSPGGRCLNALGGTETGVILNALIRLDSENSPLVLRGIPLPGKQLEILDEEMAPVKKGVSGLLRIRSSWLAEGYLDVTLRGALLRPFVSLGEEGVFLGGDVAVEEDDGVYRHLGRSGSMIKHRGEWLDTRPLAEELAKEGVGCFHLDQDQDTHSLRLWITMSSPDREKLRALGERLAGTFNRSALLPETLLAVEEFPLNVHGKRDLGQLRHLAESGEVVSLRIPGRVERVAEAIVSGDPGHPAFGGACRVRDLGLDSLELHELILRIGSKGISPSASLRDLMIRDPGMAPIFSKTDGETGSAVVLWFGDGIHSLHHALGMRLTSYHWNTNEIPDQVIGADCETIQELAVRILEMVGPAGIPNRVLVGGYSFGAVMALEVAGLLFHQGTQVPGVLLLDPPDLDRWSIRSIWHWSRFRTQAVDFIIRTLCLLLPIDSLSNRLGHRREKIRITLMRERRRDLMRQYRPGSIPFPVTLATSRSHHDGAVRWFSKASPRLTLLPLEVSEHSEVVIDPDARLTWLRCLKEMIFSYSSRSPRTQES